MIFAWALLVAGEPTTIDRYPSIVQVEFRSLVLWSQSCAASILTPQYVLSAAHCFDGILYSDSNRRIRAGTTNRNSGGIVINIISRVNHPDYGWRNNDADISVVRLASTLTYNNNIRNVPIVQQGFNVYDNYPVVHAGWGTTSSGGQVSPVLRDVTIYTVNNDVCRQRYLQMRPIPATVTVNMICAGILDVGGKDACQGDSGGPLYVNDVNGAASLIGVVSWGAGCADAFYPGVSTRVASYTNWIVDTVERAI